MIPQRLKIFKCHVPNTEIHIEFNQKDKYVKKQRPCGENYVDFLCLTDLLIS